MLKNFNFETAVKFTTWVVFLDSENNSPSVFSGKLIELTTMFGFALSQNCNLNPKVIIKFHTDRISFIFVYISQKERPKHI